MAMYKPRWHRDQIVRELSGELESAVWSYASAGRVLLPEPPPLAEWVHYFHPSWYDSTSFSVVVESYMRTDNWNPDVSRARPDQRPLYRTEVSEKIFKPMMGQHPFVAYGSVDTLAYLHRCGFETFNHLWSESYDTVLQDQDRFDTVTALVKQICTRWQAGERFDDALTREKIRHNHARLFDRELVISRFVAEIIRDIREFAE